MWCGYVKLIWYNSNKCHTVSIVLSSFVPFIILVDISCDTWCILIKFIKNYIWFIDFMNTIIISLQSFLVKRNSNQKYLRKNSSNLCNQQMSIYHSLHCHLQTYWFLYIITPINYIYYSFSFFFLIFIYGSNETIIAQSNYYFLISISNIIIRANYNLPTCGLIKI